MQNEVETVVNDFNSVTNRILGLIQQLVINSKDECPDFGTSCVWINMSGYSRIIINHGDLCLVTDNGCLAYICNLPWEDLLEILEKNTDT